MSIQVVRVSSMEFLDPLDAREGDGIWRVELSEGAEKITQMLSIDAAKRLDLLAGFIKIEFCGENAKHFISMDDSVVLTRRQLLTH